MLRAAAKTVEQILHGDRADVVVDAITKDMLKAEVSTRSTPARVLGAPLREYSEYPASVAL